VVSLLAKSLARQSDAGARSLELCGAEESQFEMSDIMVGGRLVVIDR
jgi:hypothetical protein